ncbi:MAG: cellulase family glycosylhydrolase [Leptospiraceae bacterium]|nr:cellulase family glycosylhydrolase [Leptospiraceae bacterium]MCK6380818.1 cellulase family glycosylhydrolase [Leptospiraceae bacterium]NUM41911.1 cellulase family glycosylhydrolase [Leptospiraceae bacterium]
MDRLTSKNGFFTDPKGNIIFLRGVNFSGSAKVPTTPDGTTHYDQSQSFDNHRDVSFIGRPVLEEEADEHFRRLKKWGFNFLRFLVTWEAIEHKAPGKYDEAYLNYIVRMVELAGKYGFYLFIDPHQDVWSRFTGGDGAPGWTLESVGMDISKFRNSDTTIVHHEMGSKYKKMVWPLNYQKYPTATMFSLFFGGKVFAPNCKIEGKNIQDYLQDHFIAAISRLAKKLSRFKHVVGFDSLNEPHPGFIARKNLGEFEGIGFGSLIGSTPFQEMYMSEGISSNVHNRLFFGNLSIPFKKVVLNPKKISIWKEKFGCVWKKHGVWELDPNGAPMLLKPDYFYKVRGKKLEFFNDFMKPFIQKYKTSIQKSQKGFFIFIESDPSKLELNWSESYKPSHASVVNATHWYNVVLLFTKKYFDWFGIHNFKEKIVFGKNKTKEIYADTIKMIKDMSKNSMMNCPTVIGETGIPMDLNNRIGYTNKDYSMHEKALDEILYAVEKNLVNVTLWNYTPDNTHSLGDRWNEEDLSIYSMDTPVHVDPDGGRGVRAFSRPYPIKTNGEPLSILFEIEKSLFKYSFKVNPKEEGQCTIYLPPIHYKNGFKVLVNSGSFSYSKTDNLLYFKGTKGIELYGITILPEK